MENEQLKTGDTDLIDVSDIELPMEDETSKGMSTKREAPIPGISPPPETDAPIIGSFKDRFVAFSIDATFLYIIYWITMVVFRSIAFGEAKGPIPTSGIEGIVFHSIFLLIALIWFVLPEFALGGSPGKLICKLSIRGIDGTHASFISVFIRNLLRPLDLILFPLFVTAAIMELTNWHQRLGDIVGRTVVLRRLGTPPKLYAPSLDIIASACGRVAAFAIDFSLAAALSLGLGLLLNPEEPMISMLLLVYLPIWLMLFFALPEWLTKTSAGKWILGYTICHEDGSAIDLSSAFTRTLWRIFDTNPFGFLTLLFSLRRQRPGDVAAGTVVIKAQREWRGVAGMVASLLIAGGVFASGIKNRDSFLHGGFEINFLPSMELGTFGIKGRRAMPANLMIKNFHFAVGDPNQVRKPSIFQPGETIFVTFDVDGYTTTANKAWIQEDLSINYPDESVGLKLENINDFNQEVTGEGPIRFENSVALPTNAQPGRYTIVLTIRDRVTRKELKEQRFFYVNPSGTGAPAPSETKGSAPSEAEEPVPSKVEGPPQSQPEALPPAAETPLSPAP